MAFTRRTDHLTASLELLSHVYTDRQLFEPGDRPDLDRMILVGLWRAILAGVGADMTGQLAARERLSTPEEQATIAAREATRARKRRHAW